MAGEICVAACIFRLRQLKWTLTL